MHEVTRIPNQIKTSFVFLNVLIALLVTSCSSTKKIIQKDISRLINYNAFENQFTGFLLVDPQKKDTLFNHNANKYFTPASNTKIFTLLTALKSLPEKIPSLKYITRNDTLFIAGTGDPSALHSYFKDSTSIAFLKNQGNIALYFENFQEEKYGPGWAWDDYQYYYQPERGSFPLYGNVVTLFNSPEKSITPDYFTDSIINLDYALNREAEKNIFYYPVQREDTLEIPFRTDTTLTRRLLEKLLDKKITHATTMPAGKKSILYSVATDSVLKRMMHESDNFLAEQLMILSSSMLSDTLNFAKARDHILENELNGLEQPPRWVDGSGLSRYNLFTPKSMVQVLSKLYAEVSRERLLHFFPVGGVNGTLEHWYGADTPYVYAKSGSLGNVYCLSGYLLTKSGKTLIFSFMNNHFMTPSSEIKQQMQAIFQGIRDGY
ncbi:D-alanyl-D-alanine carboxypeptidase/D-alanyl-D-alanine-endopeptidase [Maribacter halichondriae]|uniref:D-alanyl-D-alanine carboxypeptidase/D-alanyl-D-alanine-endopeptidase n=1 Tax=Maribacter halichondriae TaxID=2980554 RepID=UPI002359C3D9|nr:D-alanyl-D-alanine carboxypeptidase [Maribacter sp. Hal144]